MRCLVIEDEQQTARYIRNGLAEAGHMAALCGDGAEGLHLEPGQDLTVVDDIGDLVTAILSGIRHPNVLQAESERGREKVLEHYDWDRLAERLEQVWRQCATEPRNG